MSLKDTYQEGSFLGKGNDVWATVTHPVSHGECCWQKQGVQGGQIETQKEARSSVGKSLPSHDGKGLGWSTDCRIITPSWGFRLS